MKQPGVMSLDLDYIVRAVLSHPDFQAAVGKPKEDPSWLDKNPEAKVSVLRGIEQARNHEFAEPPELFRDRLGSDEELEDLWDEVAQYYNLYREAVDYARAVQERYPKRNPTPTLEWTENLPPDDQCSYDHCSAETPFGRFLITWKSWETGDCPTVDETPWGDWYAPFSCVELAKLACQQQFDIRLALCFPSQDSGLLLT